MVLLDRLVMTAVAELADLAVVIQDQTGRSRLTAHRRQVLPETLTSAGVWIQSDLAFPAFLSVPHHTVSRMSALYPRQQPAVEFQQELLILPYAWFFMKEQRHVMKVAQLRGSVHLFQSIEAEQPRLIIQHW